MELTIEENLKRILEPDVISYRRLRGTPDQFSLELPEGGTFALAAAERYEALDVVRWAEEGLMGVRVIFGDTHTPNDTLHGDPPGSSPIGPGIPSGSTVPEPGSALILLLGFAGATFRRRRP